MWRFLVILIVLLGAIFLITRFTELNAIADAFEKGNWHFLLLAFGVELVRLFCVGLVYTAIYRGLGLKENPFRLTLLFLAGIFVNVVAPSGIGVGGIALFAADGSRRGLSPGKISIAGVLFTVFDYAAFFGFLSLGLIVLFRRGSLGSSEIIGTLFFLLIAGSLAFFVYLAMHSELAFGNVLAWLARMLNRLLRPFLHRDYLSEAHTHEFAHESAEGLNELRQRPGNALLILALAILAKSIQAFNLMLIFLAFGVPFSAGTIIAGFSLMTLFIVISPTPGGVGIVEGAMPLALNSLGVPLGMAVVITLAYRGTSFWPQVLLGIPALRLVSRSK